MYSYMHMHMYPCSKLHSFTVDYGRAGSERSLQKPAPPNFDPNVRPGPQEYVKYLHSGLFLEVLSHYVAWCLEVLGHFVTHFWSPGQSPEGPAIKSKEDP